MTHEGDPEYLSLTDLARICAHQTELFFHRKDHDTRYCFELFKRAISENDQTAWEIIYEQYQTLVTGWVKQHRGFEVSGEEAQYFVTGAFGKISSILTAEKLSNFSDLQSLLYYLKMCVHSVITDNTRSLGHANSQISFEDLGFDITTTDPAVEDDVLDKLDNQAFWVQINERLKDEKEHLVMKGIFVLALKPREICDHFGDVFSEVEEVYRIKQNILARLRRDPYFHKLLGKDD